MSNAYLASAKQLRELAHMAHTMSSVEAREKLLAAAAEYEAQAAKPKRKEPRRQIGARKESMLAPENWVQRLDSM